MLSEHNEEILVEVQDSETRVDENIGDIEESVEMEGDETTHAEPTPEKKVSQPVVELIREPGKSLLPFARVQKIIKVDKEVPVIAKEATFLISFATEEFIKRLCQAAHYVAQRDKRSIVQHRDIAAVVRRADEFLFLEEIMPWISADLEAKRPKPQPSESGTMLKPSGPTLLDRFVGSTGDQNGDEDIILHADGTMESSLGAP